MDRTAVDLERAGQRLALWSVLAGAGLALVKLFVGVAANSTAVVSDGFEGSADVLSSGIVFIGLWLASRPPDDNHPYGHGRYETLASLAVGGILVITGLGIGWRSFAAMSVPENIKLFAIYPLLAGILIKSTLAVLKWRSARRLSSDSLAADAWHDVTDLFSTTVALAAVALTVSDPHRFYKADHAGSIIIGLIVVFVGVRLLRHTIDQLTDTMPDERSMKQIRAVALSVPGSRSVEKCFARRTGFKYHVDLHLEVDPDLTVRESHDIATEVREQVKQRLDWVADVLVHVEPAQDFSRDIKARRGRASGVQ
ncbi:MAG: cation diffusion facilitator family transporter [Bryobacteraceae bacterium]